ncbi:prefoldin subunit 1 isoform X2 [Pogoniulus pusillus]|uniref:prefoldin subunit 1 isoform X2 n=1 Tax=Pogoniulus pusillus TaxID=488313 RepID=UPI0030B91E1D
MAAPVDLELKKAFSELQAKVLDTQQKVKLADIQIEQLAKSKKHAHLTDTEVMMLVDETRMYEGVGRMFILQSKGVIHNQLLEKQRIAEEKIKELEATENEKLEQGVDLWRKGMSWSLATMGWPKHRGRGCKEGCKSTARMMKTGVQGCLEVGCGRL